MTTSPVGPAGALRHFPFGARANPINNFRSSYGFSVQFSVLHVALLSLAPIMQCDRGWKNVGCNGELRPALPSIERTLLGLTVVGPMQDLLNPKLCIGLTNAGSRPGYARTESKPLMYILLILRYVIIRLVDLAVLYTAGFFFFFFLFLDAIIVDSLSICTMLNSIYLILRYYFPMFLFRVVFSKCNFRTGEWPESGLCNRIISIRRYK